MDSVSALNAPEVPDRDLSRGFKRFLWLCGGALLVTALVVGFLAYLSPALLIEFASLRLCA